MIASVSFVSPMEGPKFFGFDGDHKVIYAKVVAATAVQPNPASAASLTQEDRDEAARVLARRVAKPPPGPNYWRPRCSTWAFRADSNQAWAGCAIASCSAAS